MLAALPIACFAMSFIALAVTNHWRIAFLKAAVVWGLLVVAFTEGLSLVHWLSAPAIATAWSLALGFAAISVIRYHAELRRRSRLDRPSLAAPLLGATPVAVIAIATAVVAWLAPPNTWDSMTVHMARVAHWIADGTVADYPTNILRQLYESPWSEYAVLQFQLLSGGDHFANLVQWFSMAGSAIGVSLVAMQFGTSLRGQLLAAIVAVTLPMGILQASSTQTDYVLAFWLVCAASFAVSFVARPTVPAAGWFASSVGLAMLTKGTAYLFAAPLVVFIGLWLVVKMKRRMIPFALVFLVIPLAINAGYYGRNQAIFHNPLGPSQETEQLVNASDTPQIVASNIVRDAILQFGTPSRRVNGFLESAIATFHSRILNLGGAILAPPGLEPSSKLMRSRLTKTMQVIRFRPSLQSRLSWRQLGSGTSEDPRYSFTHVGWLSHLLCSPLT